MAADKPAPLAWLPAVLGGALLLLLVAGISLYSAPGRLTTGALGRLLPPHLAELAGDADERRRRDVVRQELEQLGRLAPEPPPAPPPAPRPQPQPRQPPDQWMPVDLSAATALHGVLAKAGANPGLVALAAGHTAAELSFTGNWPEARLAGGRPPPRTKWCAIMFNDKYRVIYLKCPKTAGNTLVSYFGLCQLDPRDTCLEFLDVYNATQVQHLHAAWPHYTVFGFSRNILARAISQYKYLTHFMAGCPGAASWDAFCADPFHLGDACLRQAQLGNLCCTQSAEHQYVHVIPQAHCFTTADGRSALDWLGRVERFEEDFAELLGLLNARPGVPRLPPPADLAAVNFAGSPCEPAQAAGQQAQQQQQQPRRALGPKLDMGSKVWQLAPGTFNPCDPLDYFRGPHARCYADLLAFFREGARAGCLSCCGVYS